LIIANFLLTIPTINGIIKKIYRNPFGHIENHTGEHIMSKNSYYELDTWTFKENVDNDEVNLAESVVNTLLFRTRQEYKNLGIRPNELANVKITVHVEEI